MLRIAEFIVRGRLILTAIIYGLQEAQEAVFKPITAGQAIFLMAADEIELRIIPRHPFDRVKERLQILT